VAPISDRLVVTETIEMFLYLLGRGVSALAGFLVGASSWPVIVLALGSVLLLLIGLIAFVSSQFRRLDWVGHQLRELSNVVQRQAQVIERLSDLLNEDNLAPAPPALPPRGIAEDLGPNMVQSVDGPIDLQEQLKVLREAMLAQVQKELNASRPPSMRD
jgi:ABC-type multidrug transport system fused ATPase/permease subunit